MIPIMERNRPITITNPLRYVDVMLPLRITNSNISEYFFGCIVNILMVVQKIVDFDSFSTPFWTPASWNSFFVTPVAGKSFCKLF